MSAFDMVPEWAQTLKNVVVKGAAVSAIAGCALLMPGSLAGAQPIIVDPDNPGIVDDGTGGAVVDGGAIGSSEPPLDVAAPPAAPAAPAVPVAPPAPQPAPVIQPAPAAPQVPVPQPAAPAPATEPELVLGPAPTGGSAPAPEPAPDVQVLQPATPPQPERSAVTPPAAPQSPQGSAPADGDGDTSTSVTRDETTTLNPRQPSQTDLSGQAGAEQESDSQNGTSSSASSATSAPSPSSTAPHSTAPSGVRQPGQSTDSQDVESSSGGSSEIVVSGAPPADAPEGEPEGSVVEVTPKGGAHTTTSQPPTTTTAPPTTTTTSAPPPVIEQDIDIDVDVEVSDNDTITLVYAPVINKTFKNYTNIEVNQLFLEKVGAPNWHYPMPPFIPGQPVHLPRNFCGGQGGFFALSGGFNIPGVARADGEIFYANSDCYLQPVPQQQYAGVQYLVDGRYSQPLKEYVYIQDCGCIRTDAGFSWGKYYYTPGRQYATFEPKYSSETYGGQKYPGGPKRVVPDTGVFDEVTQSFWDTKPGKVGVPVVCALAAMAMAATALGIRRRNNASA
jgi:hypothetical protein